MSIQESLSSSAFQPDRVSSPPEKPMSLDQGAPGPPRGNQTLNIQDYLDATSDFPGEAQASLMR